MRRSRVRSWRAPVSQLTAVAVLAAGLVVAPATQSVGEAPAAEARTIVLAAPDRVLATGDVDPMRWMEQAPIAAGDAVLVGADWGGRSDVELEVRAMQDGAWSDWQLFNHDDEHAPDADSAEGERAADTASDPIWIGRSQQVQIRSRGPRVEVELSLVDVDGDLGWTPPQLRDGAAAFAATDQPAILSRASWGADETRLKSKPREFNRVNLAIVHHTAGRNTYTPDEADDVIRSIYAYHLSKGWDDIAYNFLVDIYGRVWEGRAGGIDRPVIGGHAAGFNGGSVGVSTIGSFQTSEPPVAMLDALDALLAWKLDLHHVDPFGETEEIAGGGSSNRFEEGDRVTLPTIIGHRKTNKTTCPGDLLFEQIMGLNGDSSQAERVDAIGHPKAYAGPAQDVEQPVHGIRPRWDVDFTRTATWQLSIVDEAGLPVRRGTATGDDGISLAWDMRDENGSLVEPGTYVAQLDAQTSDGDPITPVRTTFDVLGPADRIAGASRIDTAVELSAWSFDEAERVVLASSEVFADALVAGPLAGSLDAPILLVPSTGLPQSVADEIRRLGAKRVYIVGGTSRIPSSIETQLRDRAGVTSIVRYAGVDRWDTSAKVASVLITREHPTEALLALGKHGNPSRAFPDALSAGAFGADQKAPVLLIAGPVLPGPIQQLLASRPWKDGLVAFGGTGALSADVVAEAALAAGTYASRGEDHVTPAQVLRFEGADRFDTSRRAAEELLRRRAEKIEERGPSPYAEPTGLEVVLASGANWPDALGASAAAANRGAVFVLVDGVAMERSEATRTFLQDHAADLAHGVISGGAGAVSEEVRLSVAGIVASAGPASEPRESWPGAATGGGGLFPFPFPLPTSSPSPQPTTPPSPEPTPSPSASPSPSPSPSTSEGPVADPSPSGSPSASAQPSASPSASPTGSAAAPPTSGRA